MNPKVPSQPIIGFNDIYGCNLRKRKFLESLLSSIAISYGYESLEVPLIEHASSFDEAIVGDSPWPEWDKRGCFHLEVSNYQVSYKSTPQRIPALLIPEGTIPVTRWLGSVIDSAGDMCLPMKVYYCLPCFRNEITGELNELETRQFNQFGMEILGAANDVADTEILWLIIHLLESAGVEKQWIYLRVSNIEIFSHLISECGISHTDSIILKEALDTIAECNAGKKEYRYEIAKQGFFDTLRKYSITSHQEKLWTYMLYRHNADQRNNLLKEFGDDYKNAIDKLFSFSSGFNAKGYNVIVDLSVVRSHEYYTGLSFEIDVKHHLANYVEIAGGGRYDKLVENFTSSGHARIPSTGFAFGLERVAHCLSTLGLLQKNRFLATTHAFSNSSADVVGILQEANVANYLLSCEQFNVMRQNGIRVDVLPEKQSSDKMRDDYIKKTGAQRVEFVKQN